MAFFYIINFEDFVNFDSF